VAQQCLLVLDDIGDGLGLDVGVGCRGLADGAEQPGEVLLPCRPDVERRLGDHVLLDRPGVERELETPLRLF
jgi:hypothetical protein